MENKIPEKYLDFDEAFNGPMTDPDAYEDLDMLAIREYMKKNNLKGPLTEEELKPFRRS